jgi:amino acid adenylation domain-containing protein
MTTAEFLSHLRSLDVKLWADGERLRCNAPQSILTPDLWSELKNRKQEILEFLREANRAAASSTAPLQPVSRDADLPLSFAQQRLWFLDQLEPNSGLYNISTATRLSGCLNIEALQNALDAIVARHEVLRTAFASVDGIPVQVIRESRPVELGVFDLSQVSALEREGEIQRLLYEHASRPFNLSSDLMLRASLLRLEPDQHIFVLVMHHIASDGWSLGVLFRELAALYGGFGAGQSSPLADLPIQYADYAVWHREWLKGEVFDSQLRYWKQQLSGAPELLKLPTVRPRPAAQSYLGARQSFLLSKPLTRSLTALSRQQGVTLFMTLLAAFKVLLHRYSGQEDLVVGSPVAGRNRVETQDLIGFFVNNLVLRTDLSGAPTFLQVLGRVREVCLEAYAHQDVPFEKLVEELQPTRALSRNPLFQVMFVLRHVAMHPFKLPGVTARVEPLQYDTAKFDLSLDVAVEGEELSGSLEYSTDLFDDLTIRRMLGHFETFLDGIVADPNRRISDLPMLTEAERQQVLVGWNDTASDYPRDKRIHDLVEAQVEQTPEGIAALCETEQLTYRELNARANQLAHYLRRVGVGPEGLVGIYLERSLEMLVSILGVLKAGGAYVPLDPEYPKERLAFMIADSQVRVILTERRLIERLPDHTARVICVDEDWKAVAEESAENLLTAATADNLAYVIYTSGSTGVPKGVEISHRALTNYIDYAGKFFGLTPADRMVQFASISFDLAAEEIFSCLARGATLVLRADSIVDSVFDFLEKCREWRITVLDLPTAYWHEVTAVVFSDGLTMPELIRLVVIGGERAIPERLVQWRACIGRRIRLCNGYGPTEATIVATICELTDSFEGEDGVGEVPIGHPVPNVQVYVVDQNLNPVPVGVPGELLIGGLGLARGYLNRPELTAEKFISNPFSADPNARLYRTGDLVRFRANGNLEFVGRIDQQIKIRGFRIELGEIEAVLGQHPAVRDAVVLAREDSPVDKRLIAYIVPTQAEAPAIDALCAFVKARLPDYMVPSSFVTLDALPLTANGKVNRRALPAPDQSRLDQKQAFTAPRTPVEESVAAIWAEVLKLDQISIHDNFFDLGGHSLLATRVISRLRIMLQVEVPVRSLFESPTVAELTEVVERAKNNGVEGSASTIVPLSRKLQRIKLPLQE